MREWARSLPRGALVLDLGCGHGVPISQALMDEGLIVYGIDASPALVAAFRRRFTQTPVECATVQRSSFFGRRFDAIVAWCLMFLLPPETQTALIRKVAGALMPGGRFLFTLPAQACEWPDVLTGLTSVSIGAKGYRRALEDAGLVLEREADDEGENPLLFRAQAARRRSIRLALP